MSFELISYPQEQHFTVRDIAKLWKLSQQTVRRIFGDEPGVLIIERPETRNKRGYRTMSIPGSIVQRIHSRLGHRAPATT